MIATLLPERCTATMKDLKLLSPAAAAASACISTSNSSLCLAKCPLISYYTELEQF